MGDDTRGEDDTPNELINHGELKNHGEMSQKKGPVGFVLVLVVNSTHMRRSARIVWLDLCNKKNQQGVVRKARSQEWRFSVAECGRLTRYERNHDTTKQGKRDANGWKNQL